MLFVSSGRRRALDGVSLRILPGTVVGVVGPNGAGKTTLIDVMCGLVRRSRPYLLQAVSMSDRVAILRAGTVVGAGL